MDFSSDTFRSTLFWLSCCPWESNLRSRCLCTQCIRQHGSSEHVSTTAWPGSWILHRNPKQGETLWVLDLVDQALRDMPIGIRIVRGSGQALSDTVATLYSTNHSDGVIKGEFNLDEGQYTLFVTGEGVPPLHYEYPLRIQMTNYKDAFFNAVPYIIAFLLIALLTDKFLKRRKILN